MQRKITANSSSNNNNVNVPVFAVPFAPASSMAPSTSTRSASLKQRRVSLPGTSPLHSLKFTSAAASSSSSLDPRLVSSKNNNNHNIVDGETATLASFAPSHWTFRDEMGLPHVVSMLPPGAAIAGGMSLSAASTPSATPSSFNFSFMPNSAPSSANTSPPTAAKDALTNSPPSDGRVQGTSPVAPSPPSGTPAPRARKRANTKIKPKPESPSVEPGGGGAAPELVASSSSSAVAMPLSSDVTGATHPKPRKPRKRWTMEETQSLVDGCNKWGVGNWKAILNDPQFEFQQRSPVDLKDRFRTYFPDAYRHHYPNAKTHLSSRVRSFLPDGTSIFEKTRSKKRRPFSAAEDEALRLGYEKHGTTWATIVKDPIFASQERRSTDLRDRFRNAFPELYKAAGYKPRPRASGSSASVSAAGPSKATQGASELITAAAVQAKVAERKGKKATAAKAEADSQPSRLASSTPTIRPPIAAAPTLPSAVSATSVTPPNSFHSFPASTTQKKKKRTSGAATGERPIPPGEPTAIDFYRGRHRSNTTTSTPSSHPSFSASSGSHRTQSFSVGDSMASAIDSPLPISDSETSDYGEDDDEEDEDSQSFPLTFVGQREGKKDANGFTIPTMMPCHKSLGDDGDDEDDDEDMDFAGTNSLFDTDPDGDLDGVSMDLQDWDQDDVEETLERQRREQSSASGPSGAAPSSDAISPVMSHTRSLSDFLVSTGSSGNGVTGGSRGLQDFSAELGDASGLTGSSVSTLPDEFQHSESSRSRSRDHFIRRGSSSTSMTNTTEDWNSIAGGAGHGISSSSVWLSTPGSPSTSDYFQPNTAGTACQPGSQGHGDNGGIPPRVGKSAWGPQDWLSSNPRLDHNLGPLGGSGGLTSWPSMPGTLQGNREVFDRYDLYSIVEAAHDFASEADVNHNHHHGGHHRGGYHNNLDSYMHSYPDDSIFRGFTHHRYAGDLIPGSGVAVHPPSLHLGASATSPPFPPSSVTGGNWGGLGMFGGLGALGLGVAGLGGDGVGLSEIEDYAHSVTSGSHSHLGTTHGSVNGAGASLQDLSLGGLEHQSTPSASSSVAGSGAASPVKLASSMVLGVAPEALHDDGMILVEDEPDADDGDGMREGTVERQLAGIVTGGLSIPTQDSQADDAGARTPTSQSIPMRSTSPIQIDDPSQHHPHHGMAQLASRTPYNAYPQRPHSRSVHHPGFGAASRGASQPPSEHRQLQRSLSYFDSMTIPGGSFGAASSNSPMMDDPLAYNEPLSISSLDLQYGMSAGPNIFTPLTLFTHVPNPGTPQGIAPSRTLNNAPPSARPQPSILRAQTPLQSAATPPANTMIEDVLDLSALIHSSPPPPPSRNHHRHQSVSSPGISRDDLDKKKRISWNGMLFGLQQGSSSGASGTTMDDLVLASSFSSHPLC